MSRWLLVVFVMLVLLVLSTLVLDGCPRPTPPVVAPASAACAAGNVTNESLCEGLFTHDGHACVRCPGAQGCVDKELGIYCTAGTCMSDPACQELVR